MTPTDKQEHFHTHTPEADLGMAELDPHNPGFGTEEGEPHPHPGGESASTR